MASRLKPRKKKPYRYWRDGRAMRFIKLGIALTWLASFILGIGAIWGALDPYAIFSRMLGPITLHQDLISSWEQLVRCPMLRCGRKGLV